MPSEYQEYSVVVESLTKKFGNFTAVDSVSFRVRKGEIFGFLGPNGAGKSTTIRMLCGLLEPTAGTASVGGFEISRQTDQVKLSIGYMSQRFSLYEDLTVEENINFFAGIYDIPPERMEERKHWALEMAGLLGRERELTASLSGGWKQRLALGCSILHSPPILFLDEPTGGVDPISRRHFWDLIYSLSAQGTTVFVTTHYMDEAEHCNTIGLIYAGRVIATGSPSELKRSLRQYRVFQIETSDTAKALERLESVPQIADTSLFGTRIHAMIDQSIGGEEVIRSLLDREHISLHRLELIPPSLEDVFIHLVSETDKAISAHRAAL